MFRDIRVLQKQIKNNMTMKTRKTMNFLKRLAVALIVMFLLRFVSVTLFEISEFLIGWISCVGFYYDRIIKK